MQRRDAVRGALLAPLFGVSFAAVPALPPTGLFERDPEAYWARIRDEQFALAKWRVFMNNGSLGPAPRPVLEAVIAYLEESASLASDEYHRWGYETLDAQREEMAAFCGCKKDELAFMHCATEAMSTIAGGLDLKAGDEVVITDQEHPSGRGPWQQKSARHGVYVREVKLPLPPKDPEQLADILVSAIGPRTRVLSFSGITSPTGLVLPIRQICEAARAKGVLTVVDGAHMSGQVPFRISELGCDFWAGSPHKWLFAPAGCGLLFVREEHLDRLWANTITGNWDDRKLKAARFMMVGTNNRALIEGMMAGLRFARQIGPERIHTRVHQLARTVYERARTLPFLELLTPGDDRMFGSLVAVEFRNSAHAQSFVELCRKRRIWIAGGQRLRISTHIHTRPSDIDALFEAMTQART